MADRFETEGGGLNCAICASLLRLLIPLPGFPGGDNFVLQCQNCGHGMLETHRAPTDDYLSGSTEYSRRGCEWFLSHVGGGFGCALDFGCNDGYLLRQIRAQRLIGIDKTFSEPEFELYSNIAWADAHPDLIVSRHTLEHLPDPLATLRELVEKAAPHAQFAIEVPCMDLLAESLRFDQIYNEHLHYFTVGSFHLMLRAAGLKVQVFATNRHPHSMLAVCVKGKDREEHFPMLALADRYEDFRAYTQAAGRILRSSGRTVAYGASAIFPVLLYHLGLAPEAFEAVLDDAKTGEFHGRPLQAPGGLSDATVLVTAPDSFDTIYRKLGSAKHVMSAVPML